MFVDPTGTEKAECDAVRAVVLQNALAARVIDHMLCAKEVIFEYPAVQIGAHAALEMLVWGKDEMWFQAAPEERQQLWD